MCEGKLDIEKPRRKPKNLAAPHLALTEKNFHLTEQNWPLAELTCLKAILGNTLGLLTPYYRARQNSFFFGKMS